MGLIDSVMVGRLGTTELASLAFSLGIFNLVLVLFMGFGSAISVFVSQHHSQGNSREAILSLRHGFWLHLILSFSVVIVFELLISPQLWVFGQEPEVTAGAGPYLYWIMWSLVPAALFIALRQYAEALGAVRLPMILMYIGLLLNTLLNYLLIYGHWGFPRLELEGAAIGSLIVRLLLFFALAAAIYSLPNFKDFRPGRFWQNLELRRFWEISRLGLPSSAQYAFEMAAFLGAAIMMGWMGAVALAAHHIAINLASLTFMFALGTSTAALVRVSAERGRGELREARRAGFASVLLVNIVMGGAALCFIFGRHWLAGLYTDDPAVLELAAFLLLIAGFFQLFDGAQGVLVGALRGMKDVLWPTLITFTTYWIIALPLGYVLAFILDWKSFGVWFALSMGLVIAGILLGLRFWFVTRSSQAILKE